MTRYEDLAGQAVALAKRFNIIEQQARIKAQEIAFQWRVFLECPEGRMTFVDLDNGLNFMTDRRPMTQLPNVVQAPDGLWYFGVCLTYQIAGSLDYFVESMRVGLRAIDDTLDNFKVCLQGGQEFDVTKGWAPEEFFEHAAADTENRIRNNFTNRGRTIGFVDSNL